jgi:hypothetical protein
MGLQMPPLPQCEVWNVTIEPIVHLSQPARAMKAASSQVETTVMQRMILAVP